MFCVHFDHSGSLINTFTLMTANLKAVKYTKVVTDVTKSRCEVIGLYEILDILFIYLTFLQVHSTLDN